MGNLAHVFKAARTETEMSTAMAGQQLRRVEGKELKLLITYLANGYKVGPYQL